MEAAEKPCRHEYVKIFQRKLKGLDRRLVATRAFLPIGFKQSDFGHLGEGSYCFCSRCRARLFPKRTQQEKLAARQALALSKAAQDKDVLEDFSPDIVDDSEALVEEESQESSEVAVHVEELELESVDMQDISAEGIKLEEDEESCNLVENEDN